MLTNGEQEGAAAHDLHAAGEHRAVHPSRGNRDRKAHCSRRGCVGGSAGHLPLVSVFAVVKAVVKAAAEAAVDAVADDVIVFWTSWL